MKIKCVQSDSFVIVGYKPSSAARGGIGRMLIAAYRRDDLVYLGSVGAGFKERETTRLRRDLDKLKTLKPAVEVKDIEAPEQAKRLLKSRARSGKAIFMPRPFHPKQ